jgi:hypothetical protein
MVMDHRNPDYQKGKRIARHDAALVLSAQESRQGIMTGHIRWILAISVTLAIVALVVMLAIYV